MKTSLRLTFAAVVLVGFNLSAATLYVSLESTNPVVPYTNWGTAATNIQDAVDVARNGDTVLVTNGVYAVGERDASVLDTNMQPPQWISLGMNRVVVTNSITLRSLYGPQVTSIDGMWRVRCVFLGTNARLGGFTLTNGYAADYGGGVICQPSASVSNCILVANYAHLYGGGASGGTLVNCVLTGNGSHSRGGGADSATLNGCTITSNICNGYSDVRGSGIGGGVSGCTLRNCTLAANWAMRWGGAAVHGTLYNCMVQGNSSGTFGSTLHNSMIIGNLGGSSGTFFNCTVVENEGGIWGTAFNSIVYYNSGGNYYSESTILNYCCTLPLPTNGVGNITGPPLFMDMVAGDFRLREGSPCIDAGVILLGMPIVPDTMLPYNYEPTDILGNTRFIDGNGDGIVAWDIGAYEFNSFKPPRFTAAPQRTAGGWTLNVTGEPNKCARVERSSNLRDWGEIWTGFMPADGVQQVTDYETNQLMFYRAVVP